MKFVTYLSQEKQCVGVMVGEDKIAQINNLGDVVDVTDVILNYDKIDWKKIDNTTSEELIDINSVELCAPIIYPRQDIICLGINYWEHAEESARYKLETVQKEKREAIYFSKRVNKANANNGSITIPKSIENCLDYECELAVIIGKDAKDVPIDKVQEFIFGYTIINDMTGREVQKKHTQWYFGKSLDDCCPMGPHIVTADEIEFPPKLDVKSWVNGELRQNSNTELMIFDISHVIHELSQGMTLKAGTIISTGSPSGVGLGFVPPKFLNPGDVVECHIEGIGNIKTNIC